MNLSARLLKLEIVAVAAPEKREPYTREYLATLTEQQLADLYREECARPCARLTPEQEREGKRFAEYLKTLPEEEFKLLYNATMARAGIDDRIE